METFVQITLLATGLWLTIKAVIIRTKNFASDVVFKIIPFVLGVACIISALYELSILKG